MQKSRLHFLGLTITLLFVFLVSHAVNTTALQTKKPADERNEFNLTTVSIYNEDNPIPVHEPSKKESYFKVQVVSYSKEIKEDHFKGFNPISWETVTYNNGHGYAVCGNGQTKSKPKPIPLKRYLTGIFYDYDSAVEAKNIIREQGKYIQATVVGYMKGEKVRSEVLKEKLDGWITSSN